jgi:hypothetical protein
VHGLGKPDLLGRDRRAQQFECVVGLSDGDKFPAPAEQFVVDQTCE